MRLRILMAAIGVAGAIGVTVLLAHPYSAAFQSVPPGWLYVVASDIVEIKDGVTTMTGRLSLVDSERGVVERTEVVGNRPHVAVVPGRDWLYLSWEDVVPDGIVGRFAAVDSRTWQPLWSREGVPSAGRTHSHHGRPALSGDGTLLYRYRHALSESFVPSSWIETVHTMQNSFLPERLPLSLCGGLATLHPVQGPYSLFVVCGGSQDVRAVAVSPTGSLQGDEAIVATLEARPQWAVPAQAFVHDRGRLFTVVQDDGTAITVDTISLRVVTRRRLAALGDGRSASATGAPVLTVEAVGRVYLASVGADGRSRVTVMASHDLTPLGEFEVEGGIVSLTASGDGSKLYAIRGGRSELVVLDAMTGEELNGIEIEGGHLVYAIVAQ